jgi:hypothetical protein
MTPQEAMTVAGSPQSGGSGKPRDDDTTRRSVDRPDRPPGAIRKQSGTVIDQGRRRPGRHP